MGWENVLQKLVELGGVVATSFVSGLAGGWIQGRITLKNVREAEEKLSRRMEQVEKVLPRLDPLRFAQQLLHLDRFGAVVDVCSSILNDDPTVSEAYYLRGQAHAHLHENDKAVFDLRSAVNLGERRGNVYLALAQSEAARGHWSQAEEAARTSMDSSVMEPAENSAVALTLIGESARRQGHLDDALESFDRCLEQYMQHTPAVDGKADTLIALADQKRRSFDEVIAWIGARIDENPRAASTMERRALALLRRNGTGDRAKAFEDLERSAGLWRSATKPYETAAGALIEEAEAEADDGRRQALVQAALVCFNQALNRASVHYKPAIQNWLAYAFQVQGLFAEALKHATTSYRAAPHIPNNHMALCCAHLAAGQWLEAAAVAEKWLTGEGPSGSLPAKIWMLSFSCLAKLCTGCDWRSLLPELSELHSSRRNIAGFREGWRWQPAKTRVFTQLASKGEAEALAHDIVSLLESGAPVEEFRKRWLVRDPALPSLLPLAHLE